MNEKSNIEIMAHMIYKEMKDFGLKCKGLVHDTGNCVAGHQRCIQPVNCYKKYPRLFIEQNKKYLE